MRTQTELCYAGSHYATIMGLNKFIINLIKKRQELIDNDSDQNEINDLTVIIESQEKILEELMFN